MSVKLGFLRVDAGQFMAVNRVQDFDRRRHQLIQGLLAASTSAERKAIERGRKKGRLLRQEVEAV